MGQAGTDSLSHTVTDGINLDTHRCTQSHRPLSPFQPEMDPYTLSKSRWRNGKKRRRGQIYRCRCDWCLPARSNRTQTRTQLARHLEDEYHLSVGRKAHWNSSPAVFSDWWLDFDDEFEERAQNEPSESGTGMESSWGGSSLAFVIGFDAYEALEREYGVYAAKAHRVLNRGEVEHEILERGRIDAQQRLAESNASVTSWLIRVLSMPYDWGDYDDSDWEVVYDAESCDSLSTGSFSSWEEVIDT